MAKADSTPSPQGLPLLGNVLEFVRDPTDALESWADHGDIVHISFPGQSLYYVTEPDLIEEIMIRKHASFTIGPEQRQMFSGVSQKSITASTGEDWQRRRRAVSPPFTGEQAKRYRAGMIDQAIAEIESWTEGEQFDLKSTMRRLTVTMLTETLHGLEIDNGPEIAINATDAIVNRANFARLGRYLPDWVPTRADRDFERRVAEFEAYIDQVIDRQRNADTDGTVCATLLEACDNGELTEQEVRQNLMGLLIGGNSAPSTAMYHTWHLLQANPSVHDRLIAEYEAVVGDDRLSPAAVDDLEYTEATIFETMRLFPPILGVNRQATEPVTVGGHEFEAGDQFMMSQWVPQRDGRFWDTPEAYDPDRWLTEKERPKFAYFPFGGGPRTCPGRRVAEQQLTIALAAMVGRVDLELDPPQIPLEFKPSIGLTTKQDIQATVRFR